MTETEKRRSELLEQTRARFNSKDTPPAIHPRYQNTYHSLYERESSLDSKSKIGSFGIRLFVAVLLFCMYLLADYKEMNEAKKVAGEIVRDYTSFVDFTFFD